MMMYWVGGGGTRRLLSQGVDGCRVFFFERRMNVRRKTFVCLQCSRDMILLLATKIGQSRNWCILL
jgi:hypothetical protein